MPEQVNDKKVFSLLEVAKSVEKTLNERYSTSFWVKAEMNKLNFYRHSGHCYPELVEKNNGKVIAQLRSYLWKEDYRRIDGNFQRVLKEPLKDGIKILFLAKITFDPVYGLSLWIQDIDPSYTLGDLEKEKQETIDKLREEGLYDRNKQLQFPLLPQRIAIISVETSKGYADFLNVIDNNPWEYRFFYMLFPAILQGDKAVTDITAQLRKIKKAISHFDVVAIIRGGGGDVGLSCYNNFKLAKAIATFPIPVITGIGHSTNETVSEMISFANAITPTKLAEYLIQHFHNFSTPVREAARKVVERSRRMIADDKTQFQTEIKLFRSLTQKLLSANQHEMKGLSRSLLYHTSFRFKEERSFLKTARQDIFKSAIIVTVSEKRAIKELSVAIHKESNFQLNLSRTGIDRYKDKLNQQTCILFKQADATLTSIDKNVTNMSPVNVLRRGYSITLLNGRAIKEATDAKPGDKITTTVFNGNITSIVHSTDKKAENE
ncbi:exodeoxyribonuclease VII large subunit [Danxiaibacter flavus]|uniref:Exodeoxyribonuclease 7 large subunit n=1 Tax=Danxiaibacter flavus TaxID=3049108 RepID=A0ABV3ZD41_9BACT|nr:exodeoxyribonuclease VII large subunit [Chitinophagaceae bacterium DXS]